jgi:hypothetical protein
MNSTSDSSPNKKTFALQSLLAAMVLSAPAKKLLEAIENQ